MALFVISQDRQTQVLAANAMPMATTIIIDYNSWFPWSLSPAKFSIASACNNLSDSITEIRYLGTVRLLETKTKSYMSTRRMWISCPNCPQPRFRARYLQALLAGDSSVLAGLTQSDYSSRYRTSLRVLTVTVDKLCAAWRPAHEGLVMVLGQPWIKPCTGA